MRIDEKDERLEGSGGRPELMKHPKKVMSVAGSPGSDEAPETGYEYSRASEHWIKTLNPKLGHPAFARMVLLKLNSKP